MFFSPIFLLLPHDVLASLLLWFVQRAANVGAKILSCLSQPAYDDGIF